MEYEIKVRNTQALDNLIAAVEVSDHWDISDVNDCFCGHTEAGFGLADIFEGLPVEDSRFDTTLDKLFTPNEDNENTWLLGSDNPLYSQANAVRVLKSIRDTGKFSWEIGTIAPTTI